MNRSEFLTEVATTLDMTQSLAADDVLTEVSDFDSLAVLNLLSLFDGLGVEADPEQISAAVTAQNLIDIAGAALDDA